MLQLDMMLYTRFVVSEIPAKMMEFFPQLFHSLFLFRHKRIWNLKGEFFTSFLVQFIWHSNHTQVRDRVRYLSTAASGSSLK